MVLAALTILTVMLTEFQDETSAELGSAASHRDAMQAEYAAKSAVNLSRLLIATEPTIRQSLAPIFMIMGGAPPQIPVWQYADQVLGAFNDAAGAESFSMLSGVNVAEGENLGLEGASFELNIIDEDSKINVNAAREQFGKIRLAQQLLALMGGPQYDKLFEQRDERGNFHPRQAICAAIIDWTDADQEADPCEPYSETNQQVGAEDSFYQMLKRPYQRKNAPFDSLEELHRVRGVSDDFWATFVEPDPDNPSKRNLTVWGTGRLNVNTANPQSILAAVCGYAPTEPICIDPMEMQRFVMAMTLLKGVTMGAPLFENEEAFVSALQGKGKFATMLQAMELKPITLISADQLKKSIATESKVFSIYATGVVKSGQRETRTRVHAVVDFRDAPPPGQAMTAELQRQLGAGQGAGAASPGSTLPPMDLPEGATEDAIRGALAPNPGGNLIYYKVN